MNKLKRAAALCLSVLMMMTMLCSCIVSNNGTSEQETVRAKLTVGLPFDKNSEAWSTVEAMVKEFSEADAADVTIVTVPEPGTEEYKDFLQKVKNNKIDLFVSPSNDEISELTDNDVLITVKSMKNKDAAIIDYLVKTFESVSRSRDNGNYMIPLAGSYQGLFINKDVFERAGVAVPTDWNTLMAAIPALKAKNITPFAAGFADGAGYWLDEMILAEGGTVEHSSLPSKGVINSWTRAVNDIKNIYAMGAFSGDALTTTHMDAVNTFINKGAAMILANSTELTGANADVTVISFPKAPTGNKEKNAFIGKTEMGVFVNNKSMNSNVDDITPMSSVINDFIGFMGANAGSDLYFTSLYKKDGYFPFNTDASDANETDLEETAYTMITSAEGADISLADRMLTFDNFESGLVGVLNGSTSVKDYLSSASQAEIKAQEEAEAAQENE